MDSKIFCNNTKSGSVTLRTAITKLTLTKPSLTFNQHLTDVSVNWESNNICRHPIECQMSIDTRTCGSVDAPLTVNQLLIKCWSSISRIHVWSVNGDVYQVPIDMSVKCWSRVTNDTWTQMYSILFFSLVFFIFTFVFLIFFNFNWQFYIWKLFWIC